jgi:hypothetical protein
MNDSTNWPEQTRKTTINVAVWTFSWVMTVAIATFGPIFFWGEHHIINFFAILLNVGVGIGMIRANIHHLKLQDELMRKVQLEAMGITLGVAVVGGIAYSMLDATNLIPFDADISGLVLLIGLTYITSFVINMKRYV